MELKGQHAFLYFEGAFQFSEVFLNGHHVQDHGTGYTSFTVRLDNQTSLAFGPGSVNVLAVRTDPTFGSGHWYEGGGINRPLRLVVAPHVHFVQDGVFANPDSDGRTLRVLVELEDTSAATMTSPRTGPDGAGTAVDPSANTATHAVALTLRDSQGVVVGTASEAVSARGGAALVTMTPHTQLQVWSLQTPVSYVLTARVGTDEVNVTVSVRTFDYKGKANSSCCHLRPRTTPLPEYKSILGVI